jgi:hypothetical protein
MIFDMFKYDEMLRSHNVNVMYSGPMWEEGIKGIADVVENRLAVEDISANAAKAVFSVFVEQVTNMLMYSAERVEYNFPDRASVEVSSGSLVLGSRGSLYFVQTGNTVGNDSVELIRGRLDFLNSLDKKELRRFHREQLNADNVNPESKGAGLGFIEIARRASAPIVYKFEPNGEGTSFFTMYVEIG